MGDEILKNKERKTCQIHTCSTQGVIQEMENVNGYWLCEKHADYFGDREEEKEDE